VSAIRIEPDDAGGLEPALARVLQVGTYASIALVAAGTLLLIAGGGSPLDPGPPLRLDGLLADLGALRPAGLLWLGIIGVLATPALRVVGALVGFARRGERLMVLVAALILVVVGVGIVAGLVTG
jgi:uncharacterized membrane protein